MDDKTEIGSLNYTKDDFDRKLRALKSHLQFKPSYIDIVKDDSELSYLLLNCLFWIENEEESCYDLCNSFVKLYLPQIFNKLLVEENCRYWPNDVNLAIQRRNLELIRLISSMFKNNVYNPHLTSLIHMLLDPDSFFFVKNKHGSPPSYSIATSQATSINTFASKDNIYTIASNTFPYIIELLEEFGRSGGFSQIQKYFSLLTNINDLAKFLQTFSNSIHLLSQKCAENFIPMKEKLMESLASISDEEIKKIDFHKSNTPIGPIQAIISFQIIVRHFNQDARQQKIIQLEQFNLLYRVLKVSTYNGRMFALNEIIVLLQHAKLENDVNKLSCDDLGNWAKQRDLLPALLHDSLHLQQYVERISKVILFMISQSVFLNEDIDVLWNAKMGAHPAIVSNIHDLIADIAFELSGVQIDHVFDLFLATWTSREAQTKDREIILSLVYRLAKDTLTDKVISILWEMGSRVDIISEDIMNDTLNSIVNILKALDQNTNLHVSYSNVKKKSDLMRKLLLELRHDSTMKGIPIMKLFELIGNLFDETVDPDSLTSIHSLSNVHVQEDQNDTTMDRKTIINNLEQEFSLILYVRTELINYLGANRDKSMGDKQIQIETRLYFIRYLLREGQTFLRYDHGKEIWTELIVNSNNEMENEIGFEWFTSLMGDEPDLQEESIYKFFIENILQYNTNNLTERVILCFSSFFSHIHNIDIKNDKATDNPVQLGLNYMWSALSQCDEVIAPNIINIIQNTYLNKHHHSMNVDHKEFFDECVDRLKAFQRTLEILKTTEGKVDQGKFITVKIRRVLDVLRHYVANWPWLRSTNDDVPLQQSWRGKPAKYRVHVDCKTLEIYLHKNATIGHLAAEVRHKLSPNSTSYKIQLYSDQNCSNQPYEDSHRVSVIMLDDNKINQNSGIQFFGQITNNHGKSNRNHIQPDKALAEYPNFIENLINLYDLALELDSFELCYSIHQMLLILPANDTKIINAIKNQEHLEDYFDCASLASNWYNILTLRMILFPSDSRRYNPDIKIYQYFFATNGPEIVLRLLCSSKMNETSIRNRKTRDSFLSALIEISRFITLVMTKREEMELKSQRKPNAMCNTLNVLSELDNFMFYLAHMEAQKIRSKSYKAIRLDYEHFEGLIKMIWSLANSVPKKDEELDNMEHLFKLSLEMFVLFGVISPISKVQRNGKFYSSESSFQEFFIQMLLSQHEQIRKWTGVFLEVAYTRKYGQDVADPSITLILADHLYNSLVRCHDQPDQSEKYFKTLSHLTEELVAEGKLSDPLGKLHGTVKWLETQMSKKDVNDALLEGYLFLSSTYVRALGREERESISSNMIKLLNEMVFPVSPKERKYDRVPNQVRANSSSVVPSSPRKLGSPLCDTKESVKAAMQLLVDLTNGSLKNLKHLNLFLKHNWHDHANLKEFNFYPMSQKKSKCGLVGLKNGGATCYMNAVTQQIFMIPSLRNGLLSVQLTNQQAGEKEYRYRIFNIFQGLMAHLGALEMHYFTPKLFWDNLKLCGASINVREQQDAMEYYSQIVDTLDEAMKDSGQSSVISQYLMGAFSDQKICRDCPHKYTREEQFSSISVDVKSQHSLEESLAQFVKGDLLDGENKYFCEQCQTKVACLKRLCIGKLPPYICIQLKRFDYDWEREEAIKFNDYFQFPRQLDMRPYTVDGIDEPIGNVTQQQCLYRLKGIVIHSGQASGGHYYALIRDQGKWLKFDDCDVTEIDLTNEELESQCFGGDQGEIWDSRRGNYRRGRRWWNAYLLFYESIDEVVNESLNDISHGLSDMSVTSSNSESFCVPQVDRRHVPPVMPTHIRQEVESLNASMRHQRMMFSQEFLDFHFHIVEVNKSRLDECFLIMEEKYALDTMEKENIDQLVILSVSFLFSIGFRISRPVRKINIYKSLEKPNWHYLIMDMLKRSPASKLVFMKYLTAENISHFLLYCPDVDVRHSMQHLIIFCLCHQEENADYIDELVREQETVLTAFLSLLHTDLKVDAVFVNEYFNVIFTYIHIRKEKNVYIGVISLLQKDALFDLLEIAIDNSKYTNRTYKARIDNTENMSKLYTSISLLIRHCSTASYLGYGRHNPYEIRTSPDGHPNPPLDRRVFDSLSDVENNFLELLKLLRRNEDDNFKESKSLLAFMLWENCIFSKSMGNDIFWNMRYDKPLKVKTFWTGLLREYLKVADQYLKPRIQYMLTEVENPEGSGLLGMIDKHRDAAENEYQRIYTVMKILVNLSKDNKNVKDCIFSEPESLNKFQTSLAWLKIMYKNSTNAPALRDLSNETHKEYTFVRTDSFEDLLRDGCRLIPPLIDGDEGISNDENLTDLSIRHTKKHSSD